jgi:hypothetical protein
MWLACLKSYAYFLQTLWHRFAPSHIRAVKVFGGSYKFFCGRNRFKP